MITVQYYGHSSFLIEAGEAKILFDPFITSNPAAKGISIDQIDCTHICISHGHGDHIGDTIAIAARTGAEVICNYELALWLERKGVKKLHGINIGGEVEAGDCLVKMTTAAHSSSLPDGSYAGLAAGFLVKYRNNTLYFAGDTGLGADMKFLGETENISLAFLPIGGTFTMGPADAAKAAELLRCKQVIGMHFDTYPVIRIDREKAISTFRNTGTELILMEAGEKRNFPVTAQELKWEKLSV